MMKYPGLIIVLFILLYSSPTIAQNFTTRPGISTFPAATNAQFSSATTIMNDRNHFAQPVFLLHRVAPLTIAALPMMKIIKTDDRAFDKKLFFRLSMVNMNSCNKPILPDSLQILNQSQKPSHRFLREK